jgi:hypothetical protein
MKLEKLNINDFCARYLFKNIIFKERDVVQVVMRHNKKECLVTFHVVSKKELKKIEEDQNIFNNLNLFYKDSILKRVDIKEYHTYSQLKLFSIIGLDSMVEICKNVNGELLFIETLGCIKPFLNLFLYSDILRFELRHIKQFVHQIFIQMKTFHLKGMTMLGVNMEKILLCNDKSFYEDDPNNLINFNDYENRHKDDENYFCAILNRPSFIFSVNENLNEIINVNTSLDKSYDLTKLTVFENYLPLESFLHRFILTDNYNPKMIDSLSLLSTIILLFLNNKNFIPSKFDNYETRLDYKKDDANKDLVYAFLSSEVITEPFQNLYYMINSIKDKSELLQEVIQKIYNPDTSLHYILLLNILVNLNIIQSSNLTTSGKVLLNFLDDNKIVIKRQKKEVTEMLFFDVPLKNGHPLTLRNLIQIICIYLKDMIIMNYFPLELILWILDYNKVDINVFTSKPYTIKQITTIPNEPYIPNEPENGKEDQDIPTNIPTNTPNFGKKL